MAKKQDLNKLLNAKKLIKKIGNKTMPSLIHLTPEKDNTACEVDLFNDEGLKLALKNLKWHDKDNSIFDKNGGKIFCGVCKEKITRSNLSAFFPGSVGAVCDKPGCFIVAIYKSEQEKRG